jgi:hypothetical protein
MRDKELFHTTGIRLTCVMVMVMCFAVLRSSAQDNKPWMAGTIVEVKTHQPAPEKEVGGKQYDISVKVGKMIYVILYTEENDRAEPEYFVGMARTVMIEGDTLNFNDMLGNVHPMHILSRKEALPDKSQ